MPESIGPCVAAFAAVLGVFLHAPASAQQSEPLEVTVALPQQVSISDHLEATGTFAPSATATIVARVDGYLEDAGFAEGSRVEEDQVLFRIERDTYEEQVRLYKAQFDRAEAEYQRQLRLIQQAATSQTRVEDWRAQRDAAAANLRLAEINLGYTEPRAPFAGVIGRRLVDPGNFVGPGSGVVQLAEIQRIDPIYLYFSVSSSDASALQHQISAGASQAPTEVQVAVRQDADHNHTGTVDYVDPGIDQSTGTIRLRAVLDNPDGEFLPGQFARVQVPLSAPASRLIVPNRSVQRDQAGDYVLAVDDQNVVRQKRVRVGEQTGETRVILEGLNADDRVVIKGLAYSRPGQTVKVLTE